MLLIFDCDGVLVDSELVALEELSNMMAGFGCPMDIGACRDAFMGLHNDDIVRKIEAKIGRALPADEGMRMRRRMLARLETELRPVRGVADTLRRLDMPRCVASSSDVARVRLTLQWTGLDGFFGDAIFSGCDVPQGKPAPDLFLAAASAMGVSPRDCTVIEDSPAGIAAGVAAGMRTIGFIGGSHSDAGHAARLRAAGATTIVATIVDLPEVLSSGSSASVVRADVA